MCLTVFAKMTIRDRPQLLSGDVALGLDDVDDGVYVLFADLVGAGFYHYADDRLCAALAHQDASGIAKGVCNSLY